MREQYKILVQYLPPVEPVEVARALLDNWRACKRPPLGLVKTRKDVVEPTPARIASKLKFIPHVQDSSLNLRTDEKSKPDKVRLYFSNPSFDWGDDFPPNFCAIEISPHKVNEHVPGYTIEDLCDLAVELASIGQLWAAEIELTSVLYGTGLFQLHAKLPEDQIDAWRSLPYWITFVPRVVWEQAQKRFARGEHMLKVVRKVGSQGYLVTTGEVPPFDEKEHIKRIKTIIDRYQILG